MNIILIVATTLDGKISKNTQSYVDWSFDLPLFKKQTINNTIIVGSTTFSTLKRPLLNRKIIILNKKMNLGKVLSKATTSNCFIIGGTKTYSLFLKYITDIYLTPHPFFFGTEAKPLFEGIYFNRKIVFKKKILAHKQKQIYQFQYKVHD